MKRKIAILLVFTTCFATFSTYASEFYTQNNIPTIESIQNTANVIYSPNSISYNRIYDTVMENNQTIQANDMLLDYIQTPPGKAEGLKGLWSASQGLSSVINMVSSAINGIDTSLDNANLANDYNLYLALTAGKTALEISKTDIDTQMDALNPTTDEDMETYVFQFESIKQQLIWGAQSLYMAYLNLDLTIEELEISKETLQNTINSLEKRYELGQIALLDLENVKVNLISIDSALVTCKYEQGKLLYDLNMLLGRDYDSELTISSTVTPDLEYLENIDLEVDFQSLLDTNYNYYTLQEAISDASSTNREYKSDASQNAYDMAVLNAKIEEESMRSSFNKIYIAIAEKQRLLEVEQEILANKEMNIIASNLKYELGTISLDTHNATLTEYDTQELKVKTAEYNLFVAIEQYKWATNGMITG
ncbi:MAG: TolC family protein [Clostridia bacterium]